MSGYEVAGGLSRGSLCAERSRRVRPRSAWGPLAMIVVTALSVAVPVYFIFRQAFVADGRGIAQFFDAPDTPSVLVRTVELTVAAGSIALSLGTVLAWFSYRLPRGRRWLALFPFLPLVDSYPNLDFLGTLAGLDPVFLPSQPAAIQAVGSGQVDVLVTLAPSYVPAELPVASAYPDKPIAYPALAALVASAAHPNAAQVFVDWTLTPDAQAVLNANGGAAIAGISGAKFSADQLSIVDPSDHDAAYFSQLMAKLNQDFGR